MEIWAIYHSHSASDPSTIGYDLVSPSFLDLLQVHNSGNRLLRALPLESAILIPTEMKLWWVRGESVSEPQT